MFDKNGTLIQAGAIVEIKGAYFKNDNGFWYVEEDCTNPAWLGTDLLLKKIGKTGKISTAKNNLAFWPLKAYTSNPSKNKQARDWNRKHATIEITDKVDNVQVIEDFRQRVAGHKESARYYDLHGYGEAWTKPHEDNAEYFGKALARLEAEKEADND